jgi:hypothetical protein
MNHYDARQQSDSKKWHYTCRNGRDIWAVGNCAEDAGHETAAEARACYRGYLIETAKLNVKLDPGGACRSCKKPAKEAAMVNGFPHFLCEKHMNKEGLEKAFPAVGSSVSSY